MGKYVVTYSSKKINMKNHLLLYLTIHEAIAPPNVMKRSREKKFKIYAEHLYFKVSSNKKQSNSDLSKLFNLIFSEIINPEKKK